MKDEDLSAAIKFIYESANAGIAVSDVVNHVGISRRALEGKFRAELKVSPAVFIKRIQLQSVAKLLRTTKLPISTIASRTGFNYPEVLMRAFKRVYGVTPMQFRGAGANFKDSHSPLS